MVLTVQVVMTIFGAILILAAIFDGIHIRDMELPSLPLQGRILCAFLGVGLISLSFWVDLRPHSGEKDGFSPPGETTESIPGTSHQPSTSTASGPSQIAIQVRRADGESGPLGRVVQLVGQIRGLSKPWSCYWGGWHVHAADGWTGRFIKGELVLARDGSFTELRGSW
jgi:hypothetical protein